MAEVAGPERDMAPDLVSVSKRDVMPDRMGVVMPDRVMMPKPAMGPRRVMAEAVVAVKSVVSPMVVPDPVMVAVMALAGVMMVTVVVETVVPVKADASFGIADGEKRDGQRQNSNYPLDHAICPAGHWSSKFKQNRIVKANRFTLDVALITQSKL